MTHGEIWTIDFGQPVGSLPSKIRPAVVMQNDLLGIKDLNTVVVIPFTSNLDRADFEPNILIEKEENGYYMGLTNEYVNGKVKSDGLHKIGDLVEGTVVGLEDNYLIIE